MSERGDPERDRWDRRWASRTDPVGPPSELLRALDDVLPTTGRALDVAAGRGRQARWLARRGLDVTAVDVSPVGLAALSRSENPTVRTWVADLSLDPLPAGPWDVICCVDFYLPTLFGALCAALAPGGWLVFAHPTLDNLSRHAHPSARFLVPADQVASLVPDLEIRRCDAAWRQDGRHEAWLVARRG
ncbi:MAG: class I SAM-dependent methyltransferase [Oligoflexia bacterium]|nr:class I SAM-dependent methyltransferase [Oligoflexia bacterium]